MTTEQMAAFIDEWEPKGPWEAVRYDAPKGWGVEWPGGVAGEWNATTAAYYVLESQAHGVAALMNWLAAHEEAG